MASRVLQLHNAVRQRGENGGMAVCEEMMDAMAGDLGSIMTGMKEEQKTTPEM